MNFGQALEKVKAGEKIYREGWNGRGMFIVYQKGYPDGIPCNAQTAKAWNMKEGDLFKCNPYLQIKQVDGTHSMWVPSIGDILAEDWDMQKGENMKENYYIVEAVGKCGREVLNACPVIKEKYTYEVDYPYPNKEMSRLSVLIPSLKRFYEAINSEIILSKDSDGDWDITIYDGYME